MTPGQLALAEAARAETARIYSKTLREVECESRLPQISITQYDQIIDGLRAAAAVDNVVQFERGRAAS